MSRPQTGQRMKQPASLEGFGSTTSPMISPLSGRWRSSMADRLLPVLGDHVLAEADAPEAALEKEPRLGDQSGRQRERYERGD